MLHADVPPRARRRGGCPQVQDPMDLSPSALFMGLVLSGIGFVLFRYGRTEQRAPQMLTGIALMVAPVLPGGWLVQLAVGGGLVGALWLAVRYGL